MANRNDMVVIQLNSNSLRSIKKRQEMDLFLKKYNPDLVLLNETKLNPTHKVSFTGYVLIRTDRPNNLGGGGTAILIKEGIKHKHMVPKFAFKSIECTIVLIPLSDNSNIIVASIYRSNSLQNIIDANELNKIFDFKIDDNTQFILGGDFNAHHPFWLNHDMDSNGKKLYDWYTDNFIRHDIIIKSSLYPSRSLNSSQSYLDLFFISSSFNVKHPPGYCNYLKTLPFESDHAAIELTIKLDCNTMPDEPILLKNFSKVNWKYFNRIFDSGLASINIPTNRAISNEEIDYILNEFNQIYGNTVDQNVPNIELRPNGQIPLSNSCLSVINYKSKLRRILFRIPDKSCPRAVSIKSQIKCLNVMIDSLLTRHYENYYNRKFADIKVDNNLFKNLKRF